MISRKTGIGSFASYLVGTLQAIGGDARFYLYSPKNQERDLNTLQRLWWESVHLPRVAHRDRVDILYSPGFSPPPLGRFKKIATVHDLIGLIHPGNNRGAASRFYWSRWLARNLRGADILIASSESTKRDIVRLLGVPADRVCVVYLAVGPQFGVVQDKKSVDETLRKHGLRRPFLISVSTLEPRKNHLGFLRACEAYFKENRDLSLVIVGKPGPAEPDIRRFVGERGLEGQVRILGYLPEAELIHLYNAALGYVMVSLYEGFGLPVLEAMSCGLTGIVSNNSSLPEVVGDTAYKVGPTDAGAVQEALRRLHTDASSRQDLGEAALKRSKRFSMEHTARQMLEILNGRIGTR